VYPDAWAQAAELGKLWVKMPDHRPWCFLPLAGAYAIVSEAARREGLPATTAVIDVGNLGALISWWMTQGIYRFDPTLYESLWNTPLDGDLPETYSVDIKSAADYDCARERSRREISD
jgi:hypothetical protein